MQTPLRDHVHQLPSSPALEADVRTRVDGLATLFDRIISCRVLIEAPHHHHHQGGLYRVRIEIGVPHREQIVIGRTTDEDGAHADPYIAVRDAFRAAKRQLEDHVSRLRFHARSHAATVRR